MKGRTYRRMLSHIKTLVASRDKLQSEVTFLRARNGVLADELAASQKLVRAAANARLTAKLIARDPG